ncbi:MAG: murein biosynthesis integral membrane protein MurJ [Anaerolineae bacterium]|nr:murein biosynthesis integral membrane protein MurJ [Anaerolineae bacterium]
MSIDIDPRTELLPEYPAESNDDAAASNLARATTILALGNIASRVLGFVREILLSNFFGPSRQVDALQIALTVPQDLYDLAISGHLNSALVPTLSEYAAKDRRELWKIVNTLLGFLLLATGVLTLILMFFAAPVILLYRGAPRTPAAIELMDTVLNFKQCSFNFCAPSFTPEAYDLSIHLLRITAPALIFLTLFAILSGTLFALRRFAFPAFAAALFNGVLAISIVVLVPQIGIVGAALGWGLGALAQLILQLGGLRDGQIRPTIRGLREGLRHPAIRRIGLLYLPVLFSLAIDVLINRPFSYNLASQGGDGNISYMNWATQLREFPMGLVGTAISLAILPTLSRQALREELTDDFKNTLGQGIRLALTLIIPATVGIFVLGGPLIGLMFERGAFTAENTAVTAQVLRLYLLGIPFAAVDLLLIFAFYAKKDSLTPALIGVFSLGCYIVIALVLNPYIGFFSLMIADSLKHLIHMIVSFVLLRRRLGGMGNQRLLITVLKVLSATTVMALVTYVLLRSVVELFPVQDIRQRLLLVGLPAILGGITYLLLASLLKLNELTLFIRSLRRRIKT